ncbi:MAG: hypothetical protein K8T26_12585 [Lentisphaerae bacterium]|nr:hypothetical protein [Lentisphaerota bacterium]
MRRATLGAGVLAVGAALTAAAAPIHVTYLWHMHQPVYYPYESANDTDANGRYNFSIRGVHDERAGNYTTWPKDAVEQAAGRAGLEHAGAQCSFSGSLAENLNNLWGSSTTAGWDDAYDYARNTLRTSLNNPRLDMVGMAYHHSLMPLTCKESMRMQIRLHKEIYKELWNTSEYSKGFWPPECAFAEWMIPALVEEGLEWVLVDNGHFDRACRNYPWVPATSVRPNPADQQNPDPATIGSSWVQLNNVWAPSKVSAPWGYQPHRVKYVNPWTGGEQTLVAVPCARYEGNENGRGGYGAFKPENVWGDKVGSNNDAAHPMLMVCHSDGDNYGLKNSDAWHGQHGNFLNMCQSNPDFDNTTVQDYLSMYPVAAGDVIHVEPGSWVGIDGGTPYFDKWRESNAGFRGDPDEHPDFWSWSVIVAAQNRVLQADRLESAYSMNDVRWGIGADTAKAWHYYLQGETSCHWYWDYDRDNPWDGNTTRACNLAVAEANKVLARHAGQDPQPPSIFPPQRSTYNPGGFLYNEPAAQPSDFQVWSFVDDAGGLAAVRLYWRADLDNQNPVGENDNEVYARNAAKVGPWTIGVMTNQWYPLHYGPKVPEPASRAQMWSAWIAGQNDVLLDYFVEAVDNAGNTNRSDVMHVFVGQRVGEPTVATAPLPAEACKPLTIRYNPEGRPLEGVSPVKVQLDWEPSVSPPVAIDLVADGSAWSCTTAIPADQTNVVFSFHNGAGTVDNNSNLLWSASIGPCLTESPAEVAFDPPAPSGCVPVTITYRPNSGLLKAATNVFIHMGRNGWQDVLLPNPIMTPAGTGVWSYAYAVPAATYRIECVFNNGEGQWDNNQGNDYRVNVTGCAAPAVAVSAVPGTLTVGDDPIGQNAPGEAFSLATNGNAAVTLVQGGFGAFGSVYVNYDATNLYVGGAGMDMVGGNNAAIIFLGVDTLSDNANHLWDKSGKPQALDHLHNVWFNNPAPDIAIVLGDEFGDGEFPDFDLLSGYNMGQGVYYLSATSFVAVAGARLAQFDGSGTNATIGADDDGNQLTDRWVCALPWSSLNATGMESVGACSLAGLFVSDGTNGVDRYVSGNVLGMATPATNGNYGFTFVTVTGLPVLVPAQDSDGDGLPDAWERRHFDTDTGAGRDVDEDGDGFSNWDEYRLGTQPTNGESRLALEGITRTGDVARVVWTSVGGREYLVQYSDDLLRGFNNLTNVPERDVAAGAEATEGVDDHLDISGSTNRFRAYRVRLWP